MLQPIELDNQTIITAGEDEDINIYKKKHYDMLMGVDESDIILNLDEV